LFSKCQKPRSQRGISPHIHKFERIDRPESVTILPLSLSARALLDLPSSISKNMLDSLLELKNMKVVLFSRISFRRFCSVCPNSPSVDKCEVNIEDSAGEFSNSFRSVLVRVKSLSESTFVSTTKSASFFLFILFVQWIERILV
jgi:hypothetical protein